MKLDQRAWSMILVGAWISLACGCGPSPDPLIGTVTPNGRITNVQRQPDGTVRYSTETGEEFSAKVGNNGRVTEVKRATK